MGDDGKEKKRGPEWNLRIPKGNNRLRRETAFLCNIRFKNDLPEIPCDPKLLLPPFDPQKVAAFKLTELERDLRRDLLFEPDLGIPLRPWNIEQYSVPEQAPPLHPADAALLASDEEAEPRRARLRGDAAEVSWLLRTKYISAEAGLRAAVPARGSGAAAAAAGAAKGGEGGDGEDPREARVRQIEAQFAAARRPLVHGKDPALEAVEVLPVFPDSLLEGRSCVLATFDANPLADVEHLAGLTEEQRARAAQTIQLKSFKPPSGPQFVALLVPKNLPQPGDDELSAAGGIPGHALAREYAWVREYQPHPRLDEKSTTFLFRFAGDGTVQFHDLNTRLELRKRKRGAAGGDEDDTEQPFVQPEMVVVRRPDTGEWAEQAEAEAAWESQPNGGARPSRDGGSGDGGATGEGRAGSDGAEEEEDGGGYQGATNAALRDVFGDDDDDI